MRLFKGHHGKFGTPMLLLATAYFGITACDAILLGDLHIEGECVPGEKRCGGDTPETCSAKGVWESGPPCDITAGKHCAAGACVVSCSVGDIRCADDYTAQACNENGEWQDVETCDACTQCDHNTGQCRSEVLPDDSPCVDANNKCLLNGTCQGGVCTADKNGSQIECLEAGECSPGVCDPSTGSCMAKNGTPCDDGNVCTTSGTCQGGTCMSLPTTDHFHARWNLAVKPQVPRFVYTDTVVLDKLTGLMWERKVRAEPWTFTEATSHCACLNDRLDPNCEKIPGYLAGWRVPTRIELISIVNHALYNAAIDGKAFPGTPSRSFWTSSQADPLHAWVVDYLEGFWYETTTGDGTDNQVRCVR